jgi:mutator protein MutT
MIKTISKTDLENCIYEVRNAGDKERSDDKYSKASVLVLFINNEIKKNSSILMIKRRDNLRKHAGQIAFPGGKVENGETFTEAALREAKEEVGLDSSAFQIYGYLDTYETGTGYRILPVVGFIDSKFVPIINRDEVAETFEVPFEFIMNEDNHQLQSGEWKGVVRNYYTIPYQGYNIWGATAGMIRNLYERIKKID